MIGVTPKFETRTRQLPVGEATGLAVTLPGWLYRQAALATMSRAAFRLRVGAKFDSLV